MHSYIDLSYFRENFLSISYLDIFIAIGFPFELSNGSANDNNFSIEVLESGKSKRVGKYDLKENLIQEYNSLSEAGRDNACSRTHIGECCNGKLKTYKGFIWKFI